MEHRRAVILVRGLGKLRADHRPEVLPDVRLGALAVGGSEPIHDIAVLCDRRLCGRR